MRVRYQQGQPTIYGVRIVGRPSVTALRLFRAIAASKLFTAEAAYRDFGNPPAPPKEKEND